MHLSDCTEHALLTERELLKAKTIMYNYVITIGEALEKRFPEMDFIISNTTFLDPSLRKFQQPDFAAMVNKFGLVQVSHDVLTSQYKLFQNDTTVDFQFELVSNQILVCTAKRR